MKTWNMRFSRLTGGFLGGLLCLLMVLGSSPTIAEKSVTVTFYHTDALGSVVATSDEFGNLEWRRGYQPYGEIQLPRDSNDTDTNTNALGYTGKPRDPSGLVYLGARYYDPLAGRFMAVDPAGINASNPHSFNRYVYANNNPYKYVDPNGETPIHLAIGLVLWFVTDVLAPQPDLPPGSGQVTQTTIPFDPSGGLKVIGLAAMTTRSAVNVTKSAVNVTKSAANFTEKQLAKKFKHASDFGVNTTKKNPQTLAEFQNAITSHLGDAATVQKGTYGFVKDSKVFFNSNTNNAVVLDDAGNFVTGFKLSPGTPQFNNFMANDLLR